MRKLLFILIAVSVCALGQPIARAQVVDTGQSQAPPAASTQAPLETAEPLPAPDLPAKLAEAKQLLKAKSDVSSGKIVALAVLDPKTSQLYLLTLPKDSFLTKSAVIPLTQGGHSFRVTIIRANGVNTAVRVTDDADGYELQPLMVAFPIERDAKITEIAYYTSAHPAILSPDVASAGESYVSTMLSHAADELSDNGVEIPGDIVNVAEHLCVVEHTDHKRFLAEDHSQLFPEILSLYALNQGDTFRYSVSTAGAGGMIQMIPRTYEAIRQQHSSVPLQADFVSGMRDHENALEAMLLYLKDTWKKLDENTDVQAALSSGIATKPELLAAGYNSNPVKLPSYLKNGGANWRSLIPGETQLYLQIYSEVDKNVGFDNSDTATLRDLSGQPSSPSAARKSEPVISWLGNLLATSRGFFGRWLL